jgi:hypothetical protein
MAAVRVQQATPGQTHTSGTTLTVTFASDVPVGHHIIVAAGFSGATGLTVAFSDAAGNTYTTHETTDDGSSTGAYSAIGSAKVTTALIAGQTITMTVSASVTHRLLCAYEYSGLDATAWFDAGDNTGKGTSTSPASGTMTTGNGGLVSDLLIGATGYNSGSATHSPSGSWTELDEVHTTSKGLAVDEWNNVAGAPQHTGTLSSSVLWSDTIVGFKISTGGGGSPQTIPIGQATETDTAQAVTAVKGALVVALGQATETDTAQAVTPVGGPITVVLGQATETDIAQAVTAVAGGHTVLVGQAVETDTAFAVTPVQPGVVTTVPLRTLLGVGI